MRWRHFHQAPWDACANPPRVSRMLWLLAFFIPFVRGQTWYPVNVAALVCPGSNGSTEITMNLPSSATNESYYMFTIFRTSLKAGEIHFSVSDASGKEIAQEKVAIAQLAADRRLQELVEGVSLFTLGAFIDGDAAGDVVESRQLEEVTGFDEVEEPGDSDEWRGRQLYSSRRRSSSSFSSPRRRSSFSSPRRRSTPVISPRRRSAVVASPRRRASVDSYPRRRSSSYIPPPAISGYRRRYSGSGVSQPGYGYSNPMSSSPARYGYSDHNSLYRNYGGHQPMQTKYGYSGANAVQGGSGAKIAMALGGGVLAGAASAYLLNRLTDHYNPYSHLHGPLPGLLDPHKLDCVSGLFRGTCDSCVQLYGKEKCTAEFSPAVNISRDDLVTTAFLPSNFTSPITVKITHIGGADYKAEDVCPPVGWTAAEAAVNQTTSGETNSTVWTPSLASVLWIALSPVSVVSTKAPEPHGTSSSAAVVLMSFLASGCCFCCCLGAIAYRVCFAPSKGKHDYSSTSDSEPSSYESSGPGMGYQQGAYGGQPGMYGGGYQQGAYGDQPGIYGGGHPGGMEMQAMQQQFGNDWGSGPGGYAQGGYMPGAPVTGGYAPGGYVPGRPV
mmetsp:Transcript_79167/g.229938  ORF Transcript_79167/g.229938 Transcript_79167/m.229938 type:complete len:611 (-) Transcript_79167:77-1909(-)